MDKQLKLSYLMSVKDRISKPFQKIERSTKRSVGAATNMDQKLKQLKRNLGKVASFKKTSAAIERLEKDLQAEEIALAKSKEAYEKLTDPTQEQTDAFFAQERRVRSLNTQLAVKHKRLEELNDDLKEQGINTKKLADHEKKLEASYRRTSGRVERRDRRRGRIKGFLDVASKASIVGFAAKSAIQGTYNAVAGPMGEAIEFERIFDRIRAKRKGTTRAEMKELRHFALQTSRELGELPMSVAQGLEGLITRGNSIDKAREKIRVLIDTAKAGGITVAETLEAMGYVEGGFKTKEFKRIGDLMTYVSNNTSATMDRLKDTFEESAVYARNVGMDMDSYFAVIASMTESFKGADAKEKLGQMFTNIFSKDDKALSELGTSFKDDKGNVKDVVKIMREIKAYLRGFGNLEAGKKLDEVFGDGSAAILDLLDNLDNAEKGIDSFRNAFKTMGNESTRVANEMRSGTAGALEKLFATQKALMLEFTSVFLPYVERVARRLLEWERKFRTSPAFKRFFGYGQSKEIKKSKYDGSWFGLTRLLGEALDREKERRDARNAEIQKGLRESDAKNSSTMPPGNLVLNMPVTIENASGMDANELSIKISENVREEIDKWTNKTKGGLYAF